ncbi:MAG: hypothetical protein HON10_08005 [Euryarchaeota archaeon]|jgi:hypothetical protein|nr:hypothetical protein [Euryarchaeota archaeon]
MYYYVDILIMITAHLMALRASIRTLLLIGGLAAVGAGLLTLGVGMDTPWAPWERQSDTRFPPVLFTLASFVATVAFCASTVVFHTSLKMVTNNPDTWWRVSGVLFLLTYGTYSFISQTFEAAIMLNILHLIVGIPALTLLPRNFVTSGIFPNQKGL